MRRWIGLLALLVACSSSPVPPPTEPTPTVPVFAEIPDPQRFDTVFQVRHQLTVRGVPCTDMRSLEAGPTFGVCDTVLGHIDIFIEPYSGAWDHLLGTTWGVKGPNWVIQAPSGEDTARLVQGALGGEFVDSERDE